MNPNPGHSTGTTGTLRMAIRWILSHAQLRPAPRVYPHRYAFLDEDVIARESTHL